MIEKRIAVYGDNESIRSEAADPVLMEFGSDHIAIIRIKDFRKISDIEIFYHDESLGEGFPFATLEKESSIFTDGLNDVRIFFSGIPNVLIPFDLFSEESAPLMLDLVHGPALEAMSYQFDYFSLERPIVNFFRVPVALQEWMVTHFAKPRLHHSLSRLVSHLHSRATNGMSRKRTMIEINFYFETFTLALLDQGRLQLVREFSLKLLPELDCCLLELTKNFGLDPSQSEVQVSGIIEPDSAFFQLLESRFPGLILETADPAERFLHYYEGRINYPSSYFVPFFNLIG